jgi:hypothetical protein
MSVSPPVFFFRNRLLIVLSYRNIDERHTNIPISGWVSGRDSPGIRNLMRYSKSGFDVSCCLVTDHRVFLPIELIHQPADP